MLETSLQHAAACNAIPIRYSQHHKKNGRRVFTRTVPLARRTASSRTMPTHHEAVMTHTPPNIDAQKHAVVYAAEQQRHE